MFVLLNPLRLNGIYLGLCGLRFNGLCGNLLYVFMSEGALMYTSVFNISKCECRNERHLLKIILNHLFVMVFYFPVIDYVNKCSLFKLITLALKFLLGS